MPPVLPRSTPTLDRVERALDRLAGVCTLVAGVQIVVLIAIFGWLVFGRYVLDDTPTWVEALALVLVVWITFLGAAVGVWRRSHLSIDFVREAMPPVLRTPLRWLAALGMVVFGGFLAWQGWSLTMLTWGRTVPMLGVSEGWRALPMALSGALTVVFSLFHLAALAREGRDPTEP
ncbi:MAG: TRAP transporter small permease [Paracoccaceae bacterium]